MYEAYQTSHVCSAISSNKGLKFRYESDSFTIGIDNHASKCIPNDIKYFITPLTPTPNAYLKGTGGNLVVRGTGAVRWMIEDDNSKIYTIIIKDFLYLQELKFCLLSPQHWSQQTYDNSPNPRGTWCATYGDKCGMEWGQRKYRWMTSFDPNTNTPKINSAPGSKNYTMKVAAIQCLTTTANLHQTVAFSSDMICLNTITKRTYDNIRDFMNI